MLETFLDNISNEDFLIALKSSGKSKLVEDYNIYDEYLIRFNEKPSTIKIHSEDVEFYDVDKIRDGIKKEFPKCEILFNDVYYSLKYKKNISKKEIWLLDDGYILVLIIDAASTFYSDPKSEIGLDGNSEISDLNNLIIPISQKSKYYNDDIFNKIESIFNNSILKEEKKSSIGMVAIDNGDLYVKEFNLNEKFKLNNMDLHYGDGFTVFDKKLITKLKKDKKGLVLLHGNPGTGKTFYIRHLLSKITQNDKSILYFPPSLVGTITDPNFINFINEWVNNNEKNCIILIEDAEPLLVSREEGRGNNGITNLLNLTDGLLNDIFGIQIIATFNTHIDNLDKALLRSERLIARKEFKPLNKEKSLILAGKLKIDKNKIKDDMTLADIYAIKKKNEILLHDVDTPKRPVGFKLK